MGKRLCVSITVLLEAAAAAWRIFLLLGALTTLAVVCQHVDHSGAGIEHHWNLLLGASKCQLTDILLIIYVFQIYTNHGTCVRSRVGMWWLLHSWCRSLGLLLYFCFDGFFCFRLSTFLFLLCRCWNRLLNFFFLFDDFLLLFLFRRWLLSGLSCLWRRFFRLILNQSNTRFHDLVTQAILISIIKEIIHEHPFRTSLQIQINLSSSSSRAMLLGLCHCLLSNLRHTLCIWYQVLI